MESVSILIVEDEPLIAEDLAAMLTEQGHKVCGRAHNARAALELAAQHKPDLALLDIRLNDGVDGIAVAHEFQKRRIPFLFVTSHTDAATMEQVADARPQGFIRKPFDEDDLRTQITVTLARTGPDHRVGHLHIRDKGRLVRVPVDDIVFAEADDNYTTLHTPSRKYVLISSLSALEERIASPHFIRIHRKYAVDLRRVTALEEGRVHLGNQVLPLGRTHREALRARWQGA
jgi:DNA-binding LytR/AlgR family response regulator